MFFQQKLIISVYFIQVKEFLSYNKPTVEPHSTNILHICNIYRLFYNIYCWDIYTPQKNKRFIFSAPQHGKNAYASLQMGEATKKLIWLGRMSSSPESPQSALTAMLLPALHFRFKDLKYFSVMFREWVYFTSYCSSFHSFKRNCKSLNNLTNPALRTVLQCKFYCHLKSQSKVTDYTDQVLHKHEHYQGKLSSWSMTRWVINRTKTRHRKEMNK